MSIKSNICALFIPILVLLCTEAHSQIAGFRRMDYITDEDAILSETQVWNITCLLDSSRSKTVPLTFLATNDGLFVFDGARMRRHDNTDVSTLRDLAFDSASGRLYSAGNNGFGWWKEDEYGEMVYHPLEIGEYSARLRDFWKVSISGSGRVFFQSMGRIRIYDPSTEKISTVYPSYSFRYMYDVGGDVLVQDGDILLHLEDDGKVSPVCIVKDRIMDIVECGGRRIAALERTGLLELDADGLTPLDIESNRILADAKVMSIAVFSPDRLLVGTTSGGLFITDVNGRIIHDAKQEMKTGDATVLSLAVDMNGDIWLGMEAGVGRIDIHSNAYYLENSHLGRVRGVLRLNDGQLLVGSNKGAFICKGNDLTQIPGTTGSVWSVSSFDGVPYIAHDQGLFALDGKHNAIPIYKGVGVMSIVRSNSQQDLFICGTYNGLALFRKEGNRLSFQSTISNYTGFCRYIFMDRQDYLWIRDSHKGFIRLSLDASYTRVTGRKDFRLVQSEDDRLFAIQPQDSLLLCRNREAYRVDPESEDLVPSAFGDEILADFGKRYGMPPEDRNASGPFFLGDGCYATGHLGAIRFCYGGNEIQESLYVSQVEMLGADKRKDVRLSGSRQSVPFNMNTVLIHLAGNISGRDIEYRIDQEPDSWKAVRFGSPVQISALPFGNHDIEFRIPGAMSVDCRVRLRILPPWYLSVWAIGAYILLLIGFIWGIREYNIRQARKKQEQDRIKADLKAKSKELANISFNNAKRNRQLNEIKSMLTDRKTVALIDTYLADESDWEKSEEYFNVIYDGLLEKLKSTYPGISKTDMKICVYTKLNLSTKEIADIMNISVRSVEMARYRLRKRLGLSPGQDIAQMLKDIPG